MEMLGVDAWDEKKCVHASTLETRLMHGAERQELVHHFLEARAGGARAGAGPSARAGDTRRPKVPKGRILANGLGGGTGRLPGEPGCDILELRIWYKNRSTAAGFALPDVGAERILFF